MWGDKASRSEQNMFFDDCTVEHDGSHPDQAFIPDGTGVQDHAMADRHVISDFARPVRFDMNDGEILKIGVMPDRNRVDVPPEHASGPETRMAPDPHTADHLCGWIHIHAFSKMRHTHQTSAGFFHHDIVEIRNPKHEIRNNLE